MKLLFKMVFEDIVLGLMKFVPDHYKRKKIYNEAVCNDPYTLRHVPEHYKTQKMCDDVVWGNAISLQYVPDYFVTQQQIKLWHDGTYYCNDDGRIKWYDGYKKRKAQKASIKEELMPIASHPSRWWDYCVPEDEKQETENLWG